MYEVTLTSSELDLVAQGRRIEAIRAVRARTGCGLREAKDATAQVNLARVAWEDGSRWASYDPTTGHLTLGDTVTGHRVVPEPTDLADILKALIPRC